MSGGNSSSSSATDVSASAYSITGEAVSLHRLLESNKVFYIVPVFQRPYSWKRENARLLFTDILQAWIRNDDSYFLGTINLSYETEDSPERIIVDGQQRMVTITLILCLLRDKISDAVMKSNIGAFIANAANSFLGTKSRNKVEMQMALDNQQLAEIQNSGGTTVALQKAKKLQSGEDIIAGTSGIRALLENLSSLSDLINYHKPEVMQENEYLQKFGLFLLMRCHVVKIRTLKLQQAIRIFSVNNARGLSLGSIDIIKAHLISSIKSQEDWKGYAARWERIENNLGRDHFEGLFQYVLKISTIDQEVTAEIYSLAEYFCSGESDASAVMDLLLEPCANALLYIKNCQSTNPCLLKIEGESKQKFKVRLDKLNKSKARLSGLLFVLLASKFNEWYPSVIYYLSMWLSDCAVRYPNKRTKVEQTKLVGTSIEINSVCEFLEQIDSVNASMMLLKKDVNDRGKYFNELLQNLTSKRNAKELRLFRVPPIIVTSDEHLEAFDVLNHGALYNSRFNLRHMLFRCEIELAAEEFKIGPTVDYMLNATCEHILPQRMYGNTLWKKIGDGCWAEKSARDEVIDKLGNMALLSQPKNSSASNKNWQEKKKIYSNVSYILTSNLVEINEWDKSAFEQRHKWMVSTLCQVWGIDHEEKKDSATSSEEEGDREDSTARSSSSRSSSLKDGPTIAINGKDEKKDDGDDEERQSSFGPKKGRQRLSQAKELCRK